MAAVRPALTAGNYGRGHAGWNGPYRPNTGNGPEAIVNPSNYQQTYSETMRALNQLQQQFKDDPGTAKDIQGANRATCANWIPFTNSNDPLLNERIQSALAGVEQVEMELRRKVEDTGGNGSVRSPAGEKVPQGYAAAVEEYYRKLSNVKK